MQRNQIKSASRDGGGQPARPPKYDAWREPRVAAAYGAKRFVGGWKGAKHRHDAALLARLLDAEPGVRSVLDLPAGTGRLFPALGGGQRRVVGADRSLAMLQAGAGAATCRVPRLQADARALPFRDASFDAVVSMRFFFHIGTREERLAVLLEMRRVSRQLVVVQDRHRENAKQAGRWLRSRVGLARRWRPAPSRSSLRMELEAAGLEVIRTLPVSRLLSDKLLLVARPRVSDSTD